MPSPETKTISLPAAEADRIEALVQSGAYPSAAEVIREALTALEDHNTTIEQWLREEVEPVYEELEANPEAVLTADQVAANLRARYDKRTRKTA